ncbi:hypothetical protein [Rhodopirellula baltica]|nr:hypothetical protein [Rhodopirellula baltica]
MMALSTDVRLPKRIKPVFPDRCVVCHCLPTSTAKINTNAQNPLAVFLMPILYLFGWSRVEFPLCSACEPRFYFQRWGRTVVCWLVVGVAVFAAMPHFEEWNRLTRKFAVGGLALIALVPYIAFELFVPRSFDVTSGNASTDYEFASEEYAVEFFALNKAENPSAKIEMR